MGNAGVAVFMLNPLSGKTTPHKMENTFWTLTHNDFEHDGHDVKVNTFSHVADNFFFNEITHWNRIYRFLRCIFIPA